MHHSYTAMSNEPSFPASTKEKGKENKKIEILLKYLFLLDFATDLESEKGIISLILQRK